MSKPTRNVSGPHRPGPDGQPIRSDELLPWAALHERLGWGSAAVAEARRRGLRVLKFARRQYVTGAEIIRFLDTVQDEPAAADGGLIR